MSDKLIRKSLELTLEQWKALDELADLHNSLAKSGPGHNRPSWRILIRQVADNHLTITNSKGKDQ